MKTCEYCGKELKPRNGKKLHKRRKFCDNNCCDKLYKGKIRRLTTASKDAWDELNLETFLDDAKRMTIKQLAIRYRRYESAINRLLKSKNIKPKKEWGRFRNYKQEYVGLPTSFFGLEPEYDAIPRQSSPPLNQTYLYR